jgi:hypothetical protein
MPKKCFAPAAFAASITRRVPSTSTACAAASAFVESTTASAPSSAADNPSPVVTSAVRWLAFAGSFAGALRLTATTSCLAAALSTIALPSVPLPPSTAIRTRRAYQRRQLDRPFGNPLRLALDTPCGTS